MLKLKTLTVYFHMQGHFKANSLHAKLVLHYSTDRTMIPTHHNSYTFTSTSQSDKLSRSLLCQQISKVNIYQFNDLNNSTGHTRVLESSLPVYTAITTLTMFQLAVNIVSLRSLQQ